MNSDPKKPLFQAARAKKETGGKDSEGLNPRQKQAAEAPDRPLLIVAGAGTGKTRTLVSRLRHLIRKGVPPERILALTFTNKAAREMEDRLSDVLRSRYKGPYLGTFHSLGARILRAECAAFGRNRKFVIFDDSDSLQVMKKLLKAQKTKPEEGASWFLGRISAIKNSILARDDLAAGSPSERLVPKLEAEYEQALRDNNAFDFDDLIQKPVALWSTRPEKLAKYRKMFSHILVDEYQDLNNKQYEFVRFLSGESRRISVVGDDQQTIYSWRGSNFEIFLNFETDWPEASVVVLDQNYRSSGNIIQAAAAVIRNNRKQKPKELWTENPEGEPVRLREFGDEDEEAAQVAEDLRRNLADDPRSANAVLYRVNAQSRAIEQALIERGVPYRVFGGLKFYERREIRDVVAGLRFALNPQDEVSRSRLARTFNRAKFSEFAEASRNPPDASPVALIHMFLRVFDYMTYLVKNFPNAAERRENVAELIHFAGQFRELPELLERIALLQATDELKRGEESSRPVELMTIHLAKGLEFDRVYLLGAVEGILPHARSMESEAEVEEERRLMYVAMTRARRELMLSFYDLPSRFLSEIPSELLRFESAKDGETEFSDGEERYITLD